MKSRTEAHDRNRTRDQWGRLGAAMLCAVTGTVLAGTEPPANPPKSIPIAAVTHPSPVDFESEILPLFRKNCLACHGQSKPKAGLVLETPQTIAKGGDSGAVVVPGKGEESLLLKAVTHQLEDVIMPPIGNKVNAVEMTSEELGLLKLWIDQGAKGQVKAAGPIEWQPMPPALHAIHAVAVSQDGQFAACARANHVDVYHLPSQQRVSRLSETRDGTAPTPAHRDLVQSLAFSNDGERLASGGYREVKIWRRIKSQPAVNLASAGTPPILATAVSPDGALCAAGLTGGRVSLWRLPSGEALPALEGLDQDAQALAFSPDNKRLAAAGASGAVILWDVTSAVVQTRRDGTQAVHAVVWVQGGQGMIVAQADRSLALLTVPEASGSALSEVRSWFAHEGPITALARGAGDQEVLSAGEDGKVRWWNVEDGKRLRELNHGGPVKVLAVRPDGKRVATTGRDKTVKLWNIDDGKVLAELKGDRYLQEQVGARDRKKTVAVAEVAFRKSDLQNSEKEKQTQEERIKKATEAFEPAVKTFEEKKKALENMAKTKAEAEKALASLQEDIRRVNDSFSKADQSAKQAEAQAKSAVERAALAKVAAEQAEHTRGESEAFLADAMRLAERSKTSAGVSTMTAEEKAAAEKRVADAEAVAQKTRGLLEEVMRDRETKSKLALEAKAQADQSITELAAKAFAAGQMKVDFDRVMNGAEDRLKQGTNHIQEASKKVESADKELKTAERTKSKTDTELQLAKKAREAAESTVTQAKGALQTAEENDRKMAAALEASQTESSQGEKPVFSAAFSPDNRLLATAGEDGRIHTWSADTGVPYEIYPVSTAAVEQVHFSSPNGPLIVAGATEAMLLPVHEQWILEGTVGTGTSDSPLVDRVNALAFSPDDQWLATGGGEPSRGGEIKVWRVTDRSLVKDLPQVHSDAVLSLAFSPDGTLLASGATDKFARVVDTATWEVVRQFEGHTHHVMGVSWKADGRTLATSGADKVVKLWDYRKGARKQNVQGFDKEVTSVQFIGVTDQAVVSAGDNKVRVIKEDGKEVRTFGKVDDFQHATATTPDGQWVVAGGEASVLRVWNTQSGDLVAAFQAPEAK